MLETTTLSAAVKVFTPFAKKIFKSKILPIIESKTSSYLKDKSDLKKFEKESVKHIASSTGKCSIINTIAFPNTPKKLDDLYVPLTIVDSHRERFSINKNFDIFENEEKILISDSAGMGKSTLSKKIFMNIVYQNKYIPIFIELRQLQVGCIAKQVALQLGVETKDSNGFLCKLPLAYIFDGLDEVADKDKENIINEIRKFVDNLDSPKILITSRVESYLSDFYDFSRYSIEPLKINEAFNLLSKYDPEGDIFNKLKDGIKKQENKGISEFLSTPLYVSLLFCAYRHKTVLPQKKHLFYSQVYEALFESHDLSKQINYIRPKYSDLDSSDFHSLLRRLGFWCLKNEGQIEFQKDELEIIVSGLISKANDINANAVKFVKDLTTTVPLFLKEGSSIRWTHKALMEYFATMFICNDAKDKQKSILNYLYKSDNWTSYKNVFGLCADIDYNSLRTSVIKQMLKKYISYFDSNYQEMRSTNIASTEIDERIYFSFKSELAFDFIFKKPTIGKLLSVSEVKNTEDINRSDDFDKKIKSNLFEVKESIKLFHDGVTFAFLTYLGKREEMICDILEYKCNDIFYKRRNNTAIKIKPDKFPFRNNTSYVVSDDINSLVNENFALVNEYILFDVGDEYILNFDKAVSELKSIKSDESDGIDSLIGSLI